MIALAPQVIIEEANNLTETFASFRSELLRPLVTLAIPGAIGSAPWFVLIIENQPSLKALAQANRTETIIAFTILAIFAGLIFQD